MRSGKRQETLSAPGRRACLHRLLVRGAVDADEEEANRQGNEVAGRVARLLHARRGLARKRGCNGARSTVRTHQLVPLAPHGIPRARIRPAGCCRCPNSPASRGGEVHQSFHAPRVNAARHDAAQGARERFETRAAMLRPMSRASAASARVGAGSTHLFCMDFQVSTRDCCRGSIFMFLRFFAGMKRLENVTPLRCRHDR